MLRNYNLEEKTENTGVVTLVLTDRAIDIILDLFETLEDALSYDYIKEQLKEHSYKKPDIVIRELINEGILQIDEFEPEMYLALTEYGEELWEEMYGE
ncbi:MAG: hypothetical protein IMZ58_00215 [Thermoplasmata archaeon]|nr:hypothetical protein [Thermoplasmata archaeon]